MIATINATAARQPQVVEQLLPKEAVLLMPARGEVKVLNEVGARIWTLLDGKRTLGEIVDFVCAEYAVDHAQAEHDVLAFVHDLALRNLILMV